MFSARQKTAVVVAMITTLGSAVAPGQSSPLSVASSSPAQEAISRENFAQLHTLIKPQPDEWKWAHVKWMPNLWEARRKAAAEGKPLFVWSMAGEPLGTC